MYPQLDFLSGLGAGHFFVQVKGRGKHVAFAAEATESICPFMYGGSTPYQ